MVFNTVVVPALTAALLIHFSQKQLPRKKKSRLAIIACAGYILWQLFLWQVVIALCIYGTDIEHLGIL